MSAEPGAGHERTDATLRPPLLIALGVGVLIVVGALLSEGLVAALAARAERADRAQAAPWPAEPPPGPRLQADPQRDLTEYRAAQAARLTGYGWVDPGAGTVRVPLERALELVLERGLPVRPEQPGGER